ncbi:MAG: ABC transporter substrate-binding protein [Peptococcaceae bacterium]|nr:ABC transporter substrate-binding protein [Peptococcaceae bacterium]
MVWRRNTLEQTNKIINEESQATNAYETGEVDVLSLNPTADLDYLAALPNTAQIRLVMPTCTMIRFNMSENSIMNNKDARYAVMYATDFNAVKNIAYGGLGTVPQFIISANGDETEPEFLNATTIYSDLANGPNYDLAKEYAEKAGIVGKTLTIINDSTAVFQSSCEVLQACLGNIGVNLEIVNYDAGSFKEKYASPDGWDMFPSEHSNPTNASYPLATRIITANKLCWSGPEYDAVNAQAKEVVGTFDPAKRKTLMEDFLVVLQDYSPAYNLLDNVKVYTYDSRLRGVEIFRMHDFLIKDWSWV